MCPAVRICTSLLDTKALCRPSSFIRKFGSARVESVDIPIDDSTFRPRKQQQAPQSLREAKLGFIGWGAMAQAVSLGIIRKDLTDPSNVMASDIEPAILEAAANHKFRTATSVKEVVDWADMLVMAVKPQVVPALLPELAPAWHQGKMMVSICAGVTIDTYSKQLGPKAKVVRVMPNTACLVGQAATAYAGSDNCTEQELDLVHDMFGAVGGAIHRVPEHLLDAVTGLSGSGPAYVYILIQALSDAGVLGGLPRTVSLSLATQTVLGAAAMVQESGQHPAVLKEAVTSPAGTTIAGVRVLEKMGFHSAVMEAVEAARLRSKELSKPGEK